VAREKPRGKGDVKRLAREVEVVKKLIIILFVTILIMSGCGVEKAYQSSGVEYRI